MAHSKRSNEAIKQQRIDLRTTSKIKSTLERAAELTGSSLTTFMVEASYEKAKHLIKESEIIILSDRERDRFLSLLENPNRKANTKLKNAMRHYLSRNS